jgi:hypothetical protein
MNDTKTQPAKIDKSRIRQGEIAILLATRGRPEMLREVLVSLQANTAQKDKVSLWLYIDEDDQVTLQAVEQKLFPKTDFAMHWHIGPPPAGLGETHHALWNASGRSAQVYMITVDDARFDTPGWDDLVRRKFDEYPDGVLLAFPHDPMTADVATYPIFGWSWLETLQMVFPGYFPFWFDDRWVSQVGQLTGRCAKIPVVLYPIRGKGRTRRMRSLPFWTRYFQLTLPERQASARKLLEVIHGQNTAALAAAVAEMERTAKVLDQERDQFSDMYCAFQEERHTELTPQQRDEFDAKSFQTESRAVGRLISRAQAAMAATNYQEAMDCLDATQFSDVRVRYAQMLKADCLRAAGRVAEADELAKETLAVWPRMSNLRRSFRFMGMVLNDGKRLLVGLTEKGKRSAGSAEAKKG